MFQNPRISSHPEVVRVEPYELLNFHDENPIFVKPKVLNQGQGRIAVPKGNVVVITEWDKPSSILFLLQRILDRLDSWLPSSKEYLKHSDEVSYLLNLYQWENIRHVRKMSTPSEELFGGRR
jgi:hypothetical protein